MKKVMLLTIFAALMMISSAAVAQTTASGTLTVTATVTGSINLVFNSDASGLALSSWRGNKHRHSGLRQRVSFWRDFCRHRPQHNRDQLHRKLRG